MKNGIHIINPKISICHRTSFDSIFDMSSCRKPEIQNDVCLKSPKSSEFAIFITNSGKKSLTMFISSCFNNYSIEF